MTNPPEVFVWESSYDSILHQVVRVSIVTEQEWPLLRDIIKYKLEGNITNYLSRGPPHALGPDETNAARVSAFNALDSFETRPPFTIQRIVELTLDPTHHYSTLSKYLRAIARVLSVSSDLSAFTEPEEDAQYLAIDPRASTSTAVLDDRDDVAENNDNRGGGRINGMGTMSFDLSAPSGTSLPTPPSSRRPRSTSVSSATSSTSSTRSQSRNLPLLSPIPWLKTSEDDDDRMLDSTDPGSWDRQQNGSSSPLSLRQHQNSNRSPHPATTTPTGGVVDEVDLGLGTTATGDPVVLTQSMASLSPPYQGSTSVGADDGDSSNGSTSLAQRFVRASSPRVVDSSQNSSSIEGRLKDEGLNGAVP